MPKLLSSSRKPPRPLPTTKMKAQMAQEEKVKKAMRMKKASKTPPSILQRKSTTTPYAQIFPILTGYDELANYLSPFMRPLQSEQ